VEPGRGSGTGEGAKVEGRFTTGKAITVVED